MFQFYPNHLHFNNWFGFQRLALFVETASEILDSLDRFVVFELKVTRWHLDQAQWGFRSAVIEKMFTKTQDYGSVISCSESR
jgi:hypothetical protein